MYNNNYVSIVLIYIKIVSVDKRINAKFKSNLCISEIFPAICTEVFRSLFAPKGRDMA